MSWNHPKSNADEGVDYCMFCPKCGATNDDASKFCLSCGGPMGQPAAPPAVNQQPAQTYYQPPPPAAPVKKSHTGIIVLIVLLLVLGIGAAAVFFVMSKNDDKDDKTTAAQTTVSASTTKQSEYNTSAATGDEDQPDADAVQDILNNSGLGNWDGNWNNLTPEQKAAIESYYSLLGDNVRITEDGVVMVDEDGNIVTWGGKWPNHPLTNNVPKPQYGSVFATDVKEAIVTVSYTGWTTEQFIDYTKQVKEAGFDKNIEEVNAFGVQSYTANNGNLKVNVSQAFGVYIITIEKMT